MRYNVGTKGYPYKEIVEMLKPSDLTISEFNFFTFYSHKDNEPIDNGLHVHDEYELFFLLEGEMTYEIDGKTVRPNPVQITVIPPNTQHRFLSDSNDEKKILLRGIMIHFSLKENASPAFFEDMFSTLFITDVRTYPEIIVLTHNIARYSYIFSKEEFEFLQNGLLCQLLLLLYKYSTFTVDDGKNMNFLTVHVSAYINQHITEELSLDSIAKHFKFNKIYINRIFKRDMGMPIHAYIQSRKILLARTLIFGGEKPTQAMAKSGCKTYSNVYKLFMKTYNISPSDMYVQYRKEAIESPYTHTITKKNNGK